MNYAAIIFDVSDTLIKYKPNYGEIMTCRLNSQGINVPNDFSE